ncbi:MAG TPA: hypothetical protein VMG37_03280 [Solirubrobacteraceae bacterium]|nr:hypothetical protein [Solirubrobacteraceae bacterium]
MTAEVLTSIRELDSRMSDGVQVRLLWCEHDGTLWVTAVNTKSGDAFRVEVHDGERPLDVFHHPYAYAAHHGVETSAFVVCGAEPSIAA